MNDERFNTKLRGYYDETIANINQEIDANYESLAKRGISREAVSQIDVEAYQSEAAKIVKAASAMRKAGHKVTYSDFSDEVNTRMRVYNATMRINRLEYLKSQIGLEIVRSGMNIDNALREKLTDDYISEVKRQAGILGVSAQPSMWADKRVAKVVMAQTDSATFSKRIWANQDALKARLDEVISTGIIQGQSPHKMAQRLKVQVRDTVTNHRYVTERLARTESARVQYKAQIESIRKNGYKYVQWFAEPKACAECSRISRQDNGYGPGIYKISKVPRIPEDTHPNCRCSISGTWVEGKQNLSSSTKMTHRSTHQLKGNDNVPTDRMNKILRSFILRGGTVETGPSVDEHLKGQSASAAIVDENTILIASWATEMAIREEALHARQLQRAGDEELSQLDNVKLEIEAQHLLLSYAKQYDISYNEIKQLEENLKYWQKQLESLEGGGHDA